MKRFLHLGYDDKFYSGVVKKYNLIDGISNRYLAYKKDYNGTLKFLNNCEGVHIMSDLSEIRTEVQRGDYDIIMFHSLQHYCWDFVDLIPDGKIVVWRTYGYDLYSPGPFGVDYKLIQIDSLLPRTKKAFYKSRPFTRAIKYRLAHIVLSLRWRKYGRKFIERVDYFQPVIHLEYELLSRLSFFHAQEYSIPQNNPRWVNCCENPIKDFAGAIQLCNSAGEYGNHLDVWETIKKFIPDSQEIIVPLSYGDVHYADYIRCLIRRDHEKAIFLEQYMPTNEYYDVMSRSTYFVHGALRQHAMSNIYNAIAAGRKVFLYRKSLIYQFLTTIGCVVFPIEDINEKSFSTPLSQEEHHKNIIALRNEILRRREKGAIVFNEILHE